MVTMLGKTRKIVSEQTSLLMYKSLIVPILDYRDVVYVGLTAADSSKLQEVQNSALRKCYRLTNVNMSNKCTRPWNLRTCLIGERFTH